LGKPAYAGGFLTFDSVIDFPALLPDLHAQTLRLGARMVTGATVTRLVRDNDAVTGVVYHKDGEDRLLHCTHCVMALGGWAPELLRGMGVHLPVRRWKCHMLIEGELVPRITVWLDAAGITLVPYAGRARRHAFPSFPPCRLALVTRLHMVPETLAYCLCAI
jgi:glycine/D-amino acid oxidase-like deaminating enzyme